VTPTPTARRDTRDGRDHVVYDRTFAAPIEAVWAAVTEPERLERWIGTWTGDPASGSVVFRMTAEGEDVGPENFTIDECDPPRRLALTSPAPGEEADWHLVLELSKEGGTTTLTFSQSVPSAEWASSVGPGWEYYLDRLVAAEGGTEVGAIDFDDYYPAQSEHFRRLFS